MQTDQHSSTFDKYARTRIIAWLSGALLVLSMIAILWTNKLSGGTFMEPSAYICRHKFGGCVGMAYPTDYECWTCTESSLYIAPPIAFAIVVVIFVWTSCYCMCCDCCRQCVAIPSDTQARV